MLKTCATILFCLLTSSIACAAGLGGYDPVSYFTGAEPEKGSSAITAEFQGEQYHFTSAANRERFAADPEKNLPQYGGYCAWAVAQGKLAPGDPTVSKVVDGKLYLNINRKIAARWEEDIPGLIRSGDANWPKIRK